MAKRYLSWVLPVLSVASLLVPLVASFLILPKSPEVHAALPASELWREDLVNQVVGFGKNTTGGKGGTLCEVTNLNDSGAGSLRACATASGPQWIVFRVNGTINLSPPRILIKSDKTIDGRGADITLRGCAGIEIGEWTTRPNPVSNVIIHNLKFEEMDILSCNGFIIIAEDASNIWIDHNTFHDSKDEMIYVGSNGSDGGSVGVPANGITISWNRFMRSDFNEVLPDSDCEWAGHPAWCSKAILVSDPALPGDVGITATLHHNHYDQTYVRNPGIQWAKFHSFNNYYNKNEIAMQGANQAQFNSENDIFECRPSGTQYPKVWALDGTVYTKVTGEWSVCGNETYNEVNSTTIFNPASSYAYTLETANATLRTNIINNAGWQNVAAPSPTPTPTPTTCTPTTLNVASAATDGGFAYTMGGSFGTPADSSSFPTRSTLRLFENGVEIGPAHSLHADIRNLGAGRFSHWASTDGSNEALRFSATNNTDPRTNGRSYAYCIGSGSAPSPTPTPTPTPAPVACH